MRRFILVFAALGLLCVLVQGNPWPQEQTAAAAPAPNPAPPSDSNLAFKDHIKPLLGKFCVECHGKEKHKADINFEAYKDVAEILNDRNTWEKVRDMLQSREMPPEKKPQPLDEQRQSLIRFIDAELAKLDCTGPVNPGKVTIRRLNRNEYNNTVRDLIGIDFKPAADFPGDEVGYGFDNIGDVLSLPPILMEKYLTAAEQIARQSIVTEFYGRTPVKRIEAETLSSTANGGLFEDRALSLDTEGEGYTEFSFAQKGNYIIRARAFGQQAGPEPPRMAFRVGEKDLKVVEVAAVEAKPVIYEVRADIDAGKRRLAVAYLNNYNVPDHPDPKLRGDRNLIVDYIEVEGPIGVEPPPLPRSHTRILTCVPRPGLEKECAREILNNFARRAFRRPVSNEEVERLVRFVDVAKAEGGNFEEGIQLAVQAVLVSPYFLFRWELDPTAEKPDSVRSLSDYEMASRLSYFLWSSLPDDELFALAEKGLLHHQEIVEGQVKRMLNDPKAKALVESFASQWLTIRNLDTTTPDVELFPEFDPALRTAMRKETELFFEAIMKEDRSIREFLDADFTFLNERLARHYGISGIKGEAFQRVSLDKDTRRGGILTHASILTITSNPTRTSPVSRGKWILEQILGTPPPPPPAVVPDLPDDEKAVESASLRQRMEQHRTNPDCAVCHNKMDPLGFAFENFNAIGAWRALDGKFPIDSSGTLPDGRSFSGPEELKQILKSEQTFVRSLTEKMLTFALGRGLENYDRCAVDQVSKALAQNSYKFSTLVAEIVKSAPFQMRKIEGPTP
ncbi:MAG: DUF1592 domain-containing protein [Verrucomicrobia bacterium]|nr:DUF1592 domain-containing protein [Verrucomicrobiota bacterium]